ncbi:FAD:protein FMN transferase [Desulfovibrio cuneatus]|uniref:FAD:protein FMN transferase n=1 Tax=Desulfovibrio cuneatus TaxID=159728 RepID=UPI00041EA466|nr:FAD:protein FMN transferase [Desulfovibrio cuneatus]
MLYRTINRRAFLRGASVAGVAVLAGQLVPAPLAHAANALLGNTTPAITQETYLLMGTMVTLTAHAPQQELVLAAFAAAQQEMVRLIDVYSRHTSSSALGTLNSQGSLKDAPPELASLLHRAMGLAKITEGLFNPAVQPLVDLFGRSSTAALKARINTHELHEAMALADPAAIALQGKSIRLTRGGMGLTLDGIAKGTIADAASAVLLAHGIGNFMVNAGGDIRVQGNSPKGTPWVIGIENPAHKGYPAEAVALATGAIATSGGYENRFDAMGSTHHLVNPLTGQSPRLAGVTVVAPTTELADALATAFCLMPPTQSIALCAASPGIECLLYGENGERSTSQGWHSQLV